jgi:hypothetical protein
MKTIDQKAALETKIAFLKSKQASELLVLKDQYQNTIDSFKPINLIKNSLEEVFTTPNLKVNLISGAIGFGTRYLTTNFINPNSENSVKRVLGKVLKFALKNFIGNK